jgi:ribosomal protein S19E (S16A)
VQRYSPIRQVFQSSACPIYVVSQENLNDNNKNVPYRISMNDDNIIPDFAEAFQKWIDQRREETDKQLELFNKQMEPINKLANDSLNQFSAVLQTAGKEMAERTIEVKVQGDAAAKYVTNITNTGNISNQFPSQMPAPNDLYWTRHAQLVDKVLADRHATIEKVIDTVGITIKGIINPISLAASPIDLSQIIQLLQGFIAKK